MKSAFIAIGVLVGIVLAGFGAGLLKQAETPLSAQAAAAGNWIAVPVAIGNNDNTVWLFDSQRNQLLIYKYDIPGRAICMLAGRDLGGDMQVVGALKHFPVWPAGGFLLQPNSLKIQNIVTQQAFPPSKAREITQKLAVFGGENGKEPE